MAINTPSSSISLIELSFTDFIFIPVTPISFPITSSRVEFHSMNTFPSLTRSKSFFCNIFSALRESLRCTSVTLEQIFDKYNASSTAVFPPPMTATGLLR